MRRNPSVISAVYKHRNSSVFYILNFCFLQEMSDWTPCSYMETLNEKALHSPEAVDFYNENEVENYYIKGKYRTFIVKIL